MGKREGILVVAGVVILGLVLFRQQQLEQWQDQPERVVALRRLAPRFELADQHRNIVKLAGLLGRHRIVLVFFDAELGVDRDPRTQALIDHFSALKSANIKVLAVSTATPFANAEAKQRLGLDIPFSVLTDLVPNDPAPHPTHTRWGRVNDAGEPMTGLFLIDRDGSTIVSAAGKPIPVQDEQAVLEKLSRGEWPE